MRKQKKRLDQILIDRNLIQTKSKAQAVIMAGKVYVENKQVTKSGSIFFENSNITIKKINKEWVSRGSYKLLKALKDF